MPQRQKWRMQNSAIRCQSRQRRRRTTRHRLRPYYPQPNDAAARDLQTRPNAPTARRATQQTRRGRPYDRAATRKIVESPTRRRPRPMRRMPIARRLLAATTTHSSKSQATTKNTSNAVRRTPTRTEKRRRLLDSSDRRKSTRQRNRLPQRHRARRRNRHPRDHRPHARRSLRRRLPPTPRAPRLLITKSNSGARQVPRLPSTKRAKAVGVTTPILKASDRRSAYGVVASRCDDSHPQSERKALGLWCRGVPV